MMVETQAVTIDRSLAGTLATALAQLPGVQGALVSSLAGEALGAAGVTDPRRGAALATFIASRAEALSSEDDMRGMGRMLAGSRLDHIVIATASAETLIIAAGPCYVLITLGRGAVAASVATAASLLLRRYL